VLEFCLKLGLIRSAYNIAVAYPYAENCRVVRGRGIGNFSIFSAPFELWEGKQVRILLR